MDFFFKKEKNELVIYEFQDQKGERLMEINYDVPIERKGKI